MTKARHDQQMGLPVAMERQTLDQFLSKWLEDAAKNKLRPKTALSYRQLAEHHIIPAIGNVELTKLTPQDVQDMLSGIIRKGLGESIPSDSTACSSGVA